jgi:acetylglutamate kinase
MENAIGQLLEEAGKILADRKQETQSGKCFNCIDICGVGTIETRHTEIIAALLDPQGNHGFGAE